MTKVAFISGHRDVTNDEFKIHYAPLIDLAVKNKDRIVVGDYHGVDIMAQKYLDYLGYDDVIVYHMFQKPRNSVDRYPVRGGYISDEDRDSAMTRDSDYDIAWVRAGKEKSGTQQNLDRRAKQHIVPEFMDMLSTVSKHLSIF